jgi:hypothetical protein
MIIARASIDPRNVKIAYISKARFNRWELVVLFVDDTEMTLVDLSEYEAKQAIDTIDKYAHKGPLADAVAHERVDEGGDDDECGKIGFR